MEWEKEYDEFISFLSEGWQLVKGSALPIALGLICLYVLIIGLLIL